MGIPLLEIEENGVTSFWKTDAAPFFPIFSIRNGKAVDSDIRFGE
jgi:hypothetical protein